MILTNTLDVDSCEKFCEQQKTDFCDFIKEFLFIELHGRWLQNCRGSRYKSLRNTIIKFTCGKNTEGETRC